MSNIMRMQCQNPIQNRPGSRSFAPGRIVCAAVRHGSVGPQQEPAHATALLADVSRRNALALLLALGPAGAALAQDDLPSTPAGPSPAVQFPVPPPAPEAPKPTDATIFPYEFASDLPPNLRVREYLANIRENRTRVWQQIAQQVASGNYATLVINLNVAPAADLRQAALYIPWALLQMNDFNAAVDTRKAYNNFDDHVKDLQRAAANAAAVAEAAAAPTADGSPAPTPSPAQAAQQAQLVQQAFILMSASLDQFLASVPTKYTTNSIFREQQQPANREPPPPPPPPPQQQQAAREQPAPVAASVETSAPAKAGPAAPDNSTQQSAEASALWVAGYS